MFGQAAVRLAGFTAVVLGWRPDEFWNATPEELAVILAAHIQPENAPADRATLERLKETHPDG